MSNGERHATMGRPTEARQELRRRRDQQARARLTNERDIQGRGIEPQQSGRPPPAEALARGGPPLRPPEGVRVTLVRGVTLPLPAVPIDYLALKPVFQGDVEIRAGEADPEFELLLEQGRLSVEVHRQLEEGVRRTLTARIRHQQIRLLGQSAEALIQGGNAPALALRAVIGTEVARYWTIGGLESEPLVPPEIVPNFWRANLGVYFVRLTGEWNRTAWEMELLGTRVQVVLTGRITLKAGISAGGWDWIAKMLARRLTVSGSAAVLEMASAQMWIRSAGVVNGVLGVASPVIVVVVTPIMAGLVTWTSAHIVQWAQEEGERRGLLNQFAAGYVYRVFYPHARELWVGNTRTRKQRAARQAGVRAAEEDLQIYAPEVLQQIVYVELDYAGRGQAAVSDIAYRLGEELYHGHRRVETPGRRE